MKTLIINGSTRRGGDTDTLVSALTSALCGEFAVFSVDDNITPCTNCGFCLEREGCAVNDRMTDLLQYLDECDNVVLASPVWFASLSGPMLCIASRLQTRYMSVMRGEGGSRSKNGVIILTGARAGTEQAALKSAKLIMRYMSVREPLCAVVCSMNTDKVAACDDTDALIAAREAALALNK